MRQLERNIELALTIYPELCFPGEGLRIELIRQTAGGHAPQTSSKFSFIVDSVCVEIKSRRL